MNLVNIDCEFVCGVLERLLTPLISISVLLSFWCTTFDLVCSDLVQVEFLHVAKKITPLCKVASEV